MTNKTERIEARFPAELKALAERAALASGYTLTDYPANLVRKDALKTLKAKSEIVLANTIFDHFIKVYESAPAPGRKILDAAEKLDRDGF